MHTVHLRLTSQDKAEQHDLVLSFEQEQVDLLNKYIQHCDRLSKAKIFQTGFPSVAHFNWTNTSGMKFEVSAFEYSEVCELLHLARPIFLSKEMASFEKIQGVFGKVSKGTAMSQHLKQLRQEYEKGDYQPLFQVSVNNTPLFHDSTVKAWLNGVEYHQDEEKAAVVAALEKSLSTDTMRGIFVAQLSGRIRATYMLADLAKLIVEGKPGDG